MPVNSRAFLGLLLFTAGTSAGCGSSDEGTGPSTPLPPLVATSHYALRPEVRRVAATSWDALLVPHQGRGLWLKPDAATTVSLDAGSVTVIAGRGVLKVASVKTTDDHLEVEQGPVAFQDFIEDGDISLEGGVIFDTPFNDSDSDIEAVVPEHAADASATDAPEPEGGTPAPASFKPSPLGLAPLDEVPPPLNGSSTTETGPGRSLIDSAKDLLLDGWHVQKQSASVGDDKLHYDITLTKTSGSFDAKIHMSGNINGLGTRFKVAVHDHVTRQQTFDVKTSGDAELSWAVRINKGGTGYNKIMAPGLSYKQQFFLGEVPMVLKLKSSVGVILGASGANTTTTGKVSITYTSDGGVHVTDRAGGGTGTADGHVAFDGDQGTLATGPAAFGFVATLPKVDLGVGLDGLFVVGASFSNSVSSVVTARGAVALSPCANITTKLSGKVGLFLDVTESAAGQVISTGAQVAKDLLSRTVYETQREDVTCGLNQ
ncbi:MAG: hypothetical protein JWP97_5940 [Labilithrix sp.]|nr:hypothetical protein [Labilithrix sp.]